MNNIPRSFNINVNFLNDVCKKIDDVFQQFKINTPSEISGKEKIENYIDWQHKAIPSKKRLFHISDQILQNIDNVKAISSIKNDSIKGSPLFKYQSRAVRDTFNNKSKFKHDYLLNDWGIHHFHLGKNTENDKFVVRTGDLLYAVVTDSDIFAICICPHGEYHNPEALKIIKNNWPYLFRKIYIQSEPDFSMQNNKNFIKGMRGKNALFALSIEDDTILSGCTTASGANIDAVIKSDFILYKIEDLERSATPEFILKNIPVNELDITIHSIDVGISPDLNIDELIQKIIDQEDIPITITLTGH